MSEPASAESWPESAMDESRAVSAAGPATSTANEFDDSSDFIEAVRGLYGEPPAIQATSTQRSSRSSQGI